MKIVRLNQEFENSTPARVHRPTGTILLAPSFFDHSDIEQDFILNHEIGHYILQTKNEELADWYAGKKLVDKYGIKATFRALNNSLFDTKTSDKRRISLFNKMVMYDKLNNKNKSMETLQYEQVYDNYTDSMIDVDFSGFEDANGFHYTNDYVCENYNAPIQELEATDYVNWCRYYGVDMSDADSSKKAARQAKKDAKAAKKAQKEANKQAKIDAKLARQTARTNVIQSRAEKNLAKAEGIKTGTWQGAGGAIKEGLGKALDTVKGIFGKGGDEEIAVDENGNPIYAGSESGGNKTLLYVGIGIAVIAVVVIVIIVLKKKKK